MYLVDIAHSVIPRSGIWYMLSLYCCTSISVSSLGSSVRTYDRYDSVPDQHPTPLPLLLVFTRPPPCSWNKRQTTCSDVPSPLTLSDDEEDPRHYYPSNASDFSPIVRQKYWLLLYGSAVDLFAIHIALTCFWGQPTVLGSFRGGYFFAVVGKGCYVRTIWLVGFWLYPRYR